MSEQLIHEPPDTRSGWLVPAVVQAGIVVVVFAAVGALAGAVWEWIWTPSSGVVVDHEWLQGLTGVQAEFSGTGVYVLVATVAGLLVGVVCALLLDRAELVTLVAALAGAALAGWIMAQVGHALGPEDPRVLAATTDNGTRLPSDLRVIGTSPYVAFPVGATLSLAVVLLGLSKRHAE